MTRPALIIGLGGTGQWVLTYLKKDLLELYGGKMPPNVRLLAFDTVSQAEAQRQVVGGYSGEQAAYEKQAKRIGSVQLDPDIELVHIGGDCYPLAQEIESGLHPHLDWFDVDYWMHKAGLGRDNWILDRGAGRFRQFGLLAVYKDLLGGPVRSQILRRMPAAINDILGGVEGDASFEVIVVSSVAGGTGSAMLVPFGVLARKMCSDKPVRTRAIVVLPTAFSPGRPSAELEIRGGAALRELARAMMPPEGFTAQVTFLPGNREYERVEYTRPYDGIYLIDGMRNNQPINRDPRYGVFPAASSWVREILDDQAGQWFTNYVSTNRAGAQANDPKRLAEGVFGVFGVHSLYAPERSLEQTYRLKLADRVIRELTDPRPEGPGERLVPNPLPRGADEPAAVAPTFLEQTAGYGDEQMPVTLLMNEMARIVGEGGRANRDEVDKKARAGWESRRRTEREANSWLSTLTALPAGSRFDELREEIDRETGARFFRSFPAADASSPPRDPGSQARYRELTENVDKFSREHHGGMGADGADDYGTFGDIARQCAAAQVLVFRDILRIRVLALLSENRGRGRQGYCLRVLEALERQIEEFGEFMREVEARRGQLSPRAGLQTRVEDKKDRWVRLRSERPTLCERLRRKPSRVAIGAEKAYLSAQANLLDYDREVTLHNAVRSAAAEMTVYCTRTRQEVQLWVTTLLEGDRALDVQGILSEVKADLDRTVTTIQEDGRSEEVERLVQVAARESQIPKADIEWALEGVHWDAVASSDGLRLSLALEPQGIEGGTLRVARADLSKAERRAVESENREILDRVLGQRFGQVEQVISMLEWCQNHEEYSDAQKLVDLLYEAAEPLTSVRPGAQPGMAAFSCSLNRQSDPLGYATQLERFMRLKQTGSESPSNDFPVQVIGCEDPYRLTAVRTQMGLMLEEFKTWQASQSAYEIELNKADGATPNEISELAQILQSQYTQREEKEAIALEVRWRSEGLAHRTLHPRVVSLVGKARELQTALQCFALGWVQEVADTQFPDRYHWELQVPTWDYEFWLTPNRVRGRLGELEALEALVLIERNNARGREGARLNLPSLNEALLAQREAREEGKPSLMAEAVESATGKGGLIEHWRTQAESQIDPSTDREIYRNPAYRDIADYASYYFRNSEW